MSNIGKSFRLSAAVLGSLGLVVSVIENFRHISVSLEQNFWVVLIIAFVLSLAAAWPESSSQRSLGFKDTFKPHIKFPLWKYRWIVVITLIFLAASYYRYHVVNSRGTGERPIVKPGDIPLEPTSSLSLVPSAYAYTPSQGPKLVSFTLRPEKTLYVETSGQSPMKFYHLSADLVWPIRRGGCNQEFDGKSALLALRAYAIQSNKQYILKYIESEKQLESLVADHPKIATELMPSKIEWSKLSRTDYFAILNWARNCVGIFFPVFIVTIENPTNRDLLVTKIDYKILRLLYDEPAAGMHPSESLTPTATYTHQLAGKLGIQSYPITPPFRIPANSSGSFELQLHADNDMHEDGVTFTMNVEFLTNQSVIRTDTFLLHLRKL